MTRRGDLVVSDVEGDRSTGSNTSPEFTIERDFVAYAVAGGDYEFVCCLNLLVGGEIVRSATGRNSDNLTPGSWDVTEFAGRRAWLQLVDRVGGDRGRLTVDHVVQTDRPAVQSNSSSTGPRWNSSPTTAKSRSPAATYPPTAESPSPPPPLSRSPQPSTP